MLNKLQCILSFETWQCSLLINEIISLFSAFVLKNKDVTESDMQIYVSKCLKYATDRKGGGGRRKDWIYIHLIVAWRVIKIDLISPTNQLLFNIFSMSNQGWTNVRHRRWHGVEDRLDMQIESTLISDIDSTVTFQRRFHLHIQHFLNVTSTSKYDVDST